MDIYDLFIKLGMKDEASSEAKKVTQVIGKGLATAAKVGVAAVGAAGTAIAAISKQAIDQYAEYEQLVGGMKKLYGDAATDMLGYANNAYASVGMSANDYMQSVTGFSAALLNSFGGDAKAAAEAADMAMRDIADNANTFGKYSAAELTNVYQALAKGQYQTLDNLQLGFGGTKEGMEALIAKANELRGSNDLTIDSFADIVTAIHTVQKNMNITGTTANEAATTIQGSANMMKAAWQNLLTGLTGKTAEFQYTLVDNFVNAVTTFAENLQPQIISVLQGIAQAVNQLAPIIASLIPPMIQEILPALVSGIGAIIQAVATALPGLVDMIVGMTPSIVEAGITLIGALAGSIVTALPQLAQAAIDIVIRLADYIGSNASQMVAGVITLIGGLAKLLIENAPKLLKAGMVLITELGAALIDNIPLLLDTALELVMALVTGLTENMNELVAGATYLITGLTMGLISHLPDLIIAGVQLIVALAVGLVKAIPEIVKQIPEIIMAIVQGLVDSWPEIREAGAELIGILGEGIESLWETIKGWGKKAVDLIREGIESAWQGLKDWFKGIWDGLFGGLSVDVDVNGNDNTGGNAIGLDYVPRNNYLRYLHRGEAVLTAREADEWRRGKTQHGGITIIQNIQTVPQTPVETAAATAAYFEQARWAV